MQKNQLELPQIRFFQERVKKSVHFWDIFWGYKTQKRHYRYL